MAEYRYRTFTSHCGGPLYARAFVPYNYLRFLPGGIFLSGRTATLRSFPFAASGIITAAAGSATPSSRTTTATTTWATATRPTGRCSPTGESSAEGLPIANCTGESWRGRGKTHPSKSSEFWRWQQHLAPVRSGTCKNFAKSFSGHFAEKVEVIVAGFCHHFLLSST